MRSQAIYFLLVLGLAVGPAHRSAAQEPEIRRIAASDATSGCIGNPVTPLCAVETFIACWVRADPALCRRVGVDKKSIKPRNYSIEYYVELMRTLRPEDIALRLKDTYWYRPGFIEIELQERYCFPERKTCAVGAWKIFFYTLKQVDGKWQIVGWAGPDND